MLAVAGPPPTGAGWAVEFKWDGVRAIVAVHPAGQVRAYSRNDRDITRSYPELLELPALTDRPLLLDGELVALDPQARPSFQRLQHRMHVQAPGRGLVATVPVLLYLFDLLVIDRQDITGLDYLARRAQLAALDLTTGPVRCPPHYLDIEPAALLDVATEHGLEGVVSKRVTSRYEPGRRSHAWIKTPLRHTQEVIVGGWTTGQGRRAGGLGALLLGVHDRADGRLHYVGHVGTGSATVPCSTCRRRCRHFAPRNRRSTNRCPASMRRRRGGSCRCLSVRSSTGSGPQTTGCGTRAGGACDRTSSPPTWSATSTAWLVSKGLGRRHAGAAALRPVSCPAPRRRRASDLRGRWAG